MQKSILSRALVLASSIIAVLLLWPVDALPQAGSTVTKGSFVERFFVNRFSRSPNARDYVPANIESLPPAERYAAVVKGLSDKGVVALVGSQPGDPLTRLEFVTLTYILAGGPPGKSLAEQKEFLRSKGVLDRNDIGFIKTYQGDVTVTRTGQEQAQKVTGAEPVLFRDVDETSVGAKMELQFDDGSVLSIGEDTAITIDEMIYEPVSGRRSIQLRMTVGTIKVDAAPNTHPQSRFNVVTPSMVAGVRGTVFAMVVNAQGATKLITLRGLVGARPLRAGEARPRTRRELQQAGGRAGTTTQAPPAAAAVVPGQAGQAQEVVVGAGQTTEVSSAGAPTAVQQATQQDIQQVNQATAVTAPAQAAAVTTTQVQQTSVIVTTATKASAESAVQSKQEAREQLAVKPTTEDKGDATTELVEVGKDTVLGGSTTTPTTAAVDPLAGLTGDSLKTAFLKLTDTQQAEKFGGLTTSQQRDLLARMNQTESEALLARFKPSSPFTAKVLDSLLDYGAVSQEFSLSVTSSLLWPGGVVESRSGLLNRIGILLDNLTPEQVVEFANCEDNHPTRICVGSNTSAGNFDWFTNTSVNDDEFTTLGAAVATALSRELDRLAQAGGVLNRPHGPQAGVPTQMILATASGDDIFPSGANENTFFTLANGRKLDPWFVAAEIMFNLDDHLPDPLSVTDQATQDIWGGAMRPSVYTGRNGVYQAGQLRADAFGDGGLINVSSRVAALNANGFLSYAVQVEEDIVNAAAKVIHDLNASTFAGSSNIINLIDSQIEASTIRARDAHWQAVADARAGVVFFNGEGRRVRAQQYVYRPASSPDQVRLVAITLGERGSGLGYIDGRAQFQSGQMPTTAAGIRDLPWNSYFSVMYTGGPSFCASSGCFMVVGSPQNSPLLSSLRVEIGNETPGEFFREEILGISSRSTLSTFNFAGTSLGSHTVQFVDGPHNLIVKSLPVFGTTAKTFSTPTNSAFNPRLGAFSVSSGLPGQIPSGQFRVYPVEFHPNANVRNGQDQNNPAGFNYFMNDAGTVRSFPVRFSVLGDSTTQANSGLQTSTCGSGSSPCGFSAVKFNTIWDALRVNLSDATANPESNLPTINIGPNILGIRAPAVSSITGTTFFQQDIRSAFIPFPRMIWRGDSEF
ncbi:MAG: FecR domain-containing protein [Candidatus Tectomicrobia bacterium]|uniref:FecR domain-containing protein n=1 Tax=Tectimicrobiota bacterium TaxID=2528274 RepID=A0A932HXQ2_UNCTE|nr:FecR domain-containing protein [Candidatus Tectomicrobia bacterium]